MANRQTASATSPIEVKVDVRSIGPAPPSASEKPRTSSKLPTTLPSQRAAHDLGQAFVHRDQGDDQLRRVAERRVEEPANSRTRVVGRMLGCLADQPREGNQRDRGESELGGVVDDVRVVECDDERSEKERRPQELPDHAGNPTPRRYARTRPHA